VSTMLHEFYAAQGTAPAGEAHELRRGHRLPSMGPRILKASRKLSRGW
jgi:hypothetical protein